MKITILTLFPELFHPFLETSIIGRASKKGFVEFNLINIRNFGNGKHRVVDGRPYGGGVGMVLRVDVLAKALAGVKTAGSYVILASASGKLFNQGRAQKLSYQDHLIVICGRYEGVDERFIDKYVDEEISIGDFVLTGGEIPAMAIIDTVARLIPKVLEKEQATLEESFSPEIGGLLEYPQYTRPAVFKGLKVPKTLLSGNHQEIAKWRKFRSLRKTKKVRPDLLLIQTD